MEDRQLKALIRRYYPLSESGLESHKKALDEYAARTWVACRVFLSTILLSLFGLLLYWAIIAPEGTWERPVAITLALYGGIAILCLMGIVFIKGGPKDWNVFFFFGRRLQSRRWLNRRLRNPYRPELILGAIEAIEAELKARQKTADDLVATRRQSLDGHRDRLTEVGRSLTASLEETGADQLLVQSRRAEASAALEQVLRELAELTVTQTEIATALTPAKQLATSLRALYADACQIEVIARAKGALANYGEQDKIARAVSQFQREAVHATETLSGITELIGAKLAAEAELDALIGIQPKAEVDQPITA